jgi:heme-degrading monooxygenase HmoA
MLPTPWKSFAAPRDDKEYVALLSFLPLKRYRTIPKLARLAMETMGQLAKSPGLIGYSLGAELTRKRFWTVSVWEDQQALRDFVEQIPHSRIMQELAPHMDKTAFAEWTVRASEIPIPWPTGRRHLLK